MAGAVHHVFARGNRRQAIFADDDRLAYLRFLEQSVGECDWGCLAYCLMGNLATYIALNPVRAGMTDRPVRSLGAGGFDGAPGGASPQKLL